MLTIVKSSTARGKKLLASAIIFEGESLFDIYESFSREKENAFEDCLQMCYEENGFIYRKDSWENVPGGIHEIPDGFCRGT